LNCEICHRQGIKPDGGPDGLDCPGVCDQCMADALRGKMARIERTVFEEAISVFGPASQIDMAIEECAEMIVALEHFKRHRKDPAHVAEEIADVQITIGQMAIMFEMANVDHYRSCKIGRLVRRIEQKKIIDADDRRRA